MIVPAVILTAVNFFKQVSVYGGLNKYVVVFVAAVVFGVVKSAE